MPKLVDHDARREAIAEALWRVAERDGVEAISMRAVAAEAGWSTGVVAHYFSGKDDLLAFAFRLAGDRAGARSRRRAAAARGPLRALRALLAEYLPTDDERRLEARIWFGFLDRAAALPAMGEAVRRAYAAWDDAVRARIIAAQRAGAVPVHRDPGAEAVALIALVDGITVQALASPERLAPRDQERMLDAALARLAGTG
jgi:AcrR family transcriptional regulator